MYNLGNDCLEKFKYEINIKMIFCWITYFINHVYIFRVDDVMRGLGAKSGEKGEYDVMEGEGVKEGNLML